MRKILKGISYALILSLCCSCGWLYTKTTSPLTSDIHEGTPVIYDSGSLNQFELQPQGWRVKWASKGIGDIAKNHGISEIYYADIIHISIFFGLYQKDTVVVYGEPTSSSSSH